MRIILLKDVEEIGRKHEIVSVSAGYARNYLIKKGLARTLSAGDENLSLKAEEKRRKEQEKEIAEMQSKAEKISGKKFEVPVKVGEKGQLFEGVSAKKVAEVTGLNKESIDLQEPIKELGEFDVRIAFKHNIEAKIKVVVKEE